MLWRAKALLKCAYRVKIAFRIRGKFRVSHHFGGQVSCPIREQSAWFPVSISAMPTYHEINPDFRMLWLR